MNDKIKELLEYKNFVNTEHIKLLYEADVIGPTEAIKLYFISALRNNRKCDIRIRILAEKLDMNLFVAKKCIERLKKQDFIYRDGTNGERRREWILVKDYICSPTKALIEDTTNVVSQTRYSEIKTTNVVSIGTTNVVSRIAEKTTNVVSPQDNSIKIENSKRNNSVCGKIDTVQEIRLKESDTQIFEDINTEEEEETDITEEEERMSIEKVNEMRGCSYKRLNYENIHLIVINDKDEDKIDANELDEWNSLDSITDDFFGDLTDSDKKKIEIPANFSITAKYHTFKAYIQE